jgi:hypothetical protein
MEKDLTGLAAVSHLVRPRDGLQVAYAVSLARICHVEYGIVDAGDCDLAIFARGRDEGVVEGRPGGVEDRRSVCANEREQVRQLARPVERDDAECTSAARLPVDAEVLGRALDEVGVECEVGRLDVAVVFLPFLAKDVSVCIRLDWCISGRCSSSLGDDGAPVGGLPDEAGHGGKDSRDAAVPDALVVSEVVVYRGRTRVNVKTNRHTGGR